MAANPENPYNDMATEEAPLGSSNGIQQLEDQGAHGAGATSSGDPINVADNQSFARSSRALKSSDIEGMNFTAYAEDGVTWFHYLKAKATTVAANTPSETIKTLTTAQLLGIYDGTYTNWNQVGSKTSAPIVVFSAQEGSGTQSTWKTFLGIDPSAATNQVNCYTPTGGTKTCVGPAVIFENEDAQIAPSAFVSSQQGSHGRPDRERRHLLLLVRQVHGAVQGEDPVRRFHASHRDNQRPGRDQRLDGFGVDHSRGQLPRHPLPVQRLLERVQPQHPGCHGCHVELRE